MFDPSDAGTELQDCADHEESANMTSSKETNEDSPPPIPWAQRMRIQMRRDGVSGPRLTERVASTHIGQLADCIGFHCDIVLLQLLLDFIDALRDIFCLK